MSDETTKQDASTGSVVPAATAAKQPAAGSVRIENKTPNVKNIQLRGGNTISVPPTEGGITVGFDEQSERESFDAAIQTGAVRQWIEAGELVVTSDAPRTPLAPSGAKVDPKEKTRKE